MNAGALDAHGDAQVDARPAGLVLPTVTALPVPGPLEGHGQGSRLGAGGRRLRVGARGVGWLLCSLGTGEHSTFQHQCVRLSGHHDSVWKGPSSLKFVSQYQRASLTVCLHRG